VLEIVSSVYPRRVAASARNDGYRAGDYPPVRPARGWPQPGWLSLGQMQYLALAFVSGRISP